MSHRRSQLSQRGATEPTSAKEQDERSSSVWDPITIRQSARQGVLEVLPATSTDSNMDDIIRAEVTAPIYDDEGKCQNITEFVVKIEMVR